MTPNSTIAHYRIVSKIGEGGMGAVYRATDTKLARDVAIKVLPEAFANDPDRMARFTREAQLLASLNHANIATIHGIEENAIVMELVEGPTLADRIAQGALPLDEALAIARQIAEALETAHERNIIHRDLKPANVKVTPEGKVKVLDFGLAKLADPTEPSDNPATAPTVVRGNSPTLAGMIMGTAGYMAPEQARGKRVDRRVDIWAFGIVLLEMLTGKEIYAGETVSDTLAAVLLKEPDLSALPESTPAAVRKLLRRCLDKDARRRLRDIGEARVAIEDVINGKVEEVVQPAAAQPPLLQPKRGVPLWAVSLLAVALLVLAGFLWRATRPVDRPLMRFSVDLGKEAIRGIQLTAAISLDGKRIVYPVKGASADATMLATRLLDQSRANVLAGTENAVAPFFSPDGQWIGFFTDQKLKKISVSGGAASTLADTSGPRGGAWGEDGFIVANLDNRSLVRVPEVGGTPQPLAKPEDRGMRTYRWPQMLPGGRAVLFTTGSTNTPGDYEEANIEVLLLPDGPVKTVHKGGYFGRYLPSGYLIYVHNGTLFGMPFDLVRLETRGMPVPLLEDIDGVSGLGAGQLDFSQTGTLVYLSGKSSNTPRPIVWMDANGKTQPLAAPPNLTITARISPDGKRLAFSMAGDIVVYDPQRDSTTRLTFDPDRQNRFPLWMPDGKHIVYQQMGGPGGESGIWWIRADGSGKPEKLFGAKSVRLSSLAPDGRRVVFDQTAPATGYDIWTLPLDLSDPDHPKPGKPEIFLREPWNQFDGALSPDGHWMAYAVSESAGAQIFVRPFPAAPTGGKWQISTTSGFTPVWSPNKRELFYLNFSDNRLMVATYAAKGDSFAADRPRQWSATPIQRTANFRPFDLAPDGQRVVVHATPALTEAGEKSTVHVTVLLNFFDELRRRLPPGK